MPFMLGLHIIERNLLLDRLHHPSCTGRREADIIAIRRSGAAIQALIADIADETQANTGFVRHLIHQAAQTLTVTGRNDRFITLEINRVDAS